MGHARILNAAIITAAFAGETKVMTIPAALGARILQERSMNRILALKLDRVLSSLSERALAQRFSTDRVLPMHASLDAHDSTITPIANCAPPPLNALEAQAADRAMPTLCSPKAIIGPRSSPAVSINFPTVLPKRKETIIIAKLSVAVSLRDVPPDIYKSNKPAENSHIRSPHLHAVCETYSIARQFT
jgi:hypothetical protein